MMPMQIHFLVDCAETLHVLRITRSGSISAGTPDNTLPSRSSLMWIKSRDDGAFHHRLPTRPDPCTEAQHTVSTITWTFKSAASPHRLLARAIALQSVGCLATISVQRGIGLCRWPQLHTRSATHYWRDPLISLLYVKANDSAFSGRPSYVVPDPPQSDGAARFASVYSSVSDLRYACLMLSRLSA